MLYSCRAGVGFAFYHFIISRPNFYHFFPSEYFLISTIRAQYKICGWSECLSAISSSAGGDFCPRLPISPRFWTLGPHPMQQPASSAQHWSRALPLAISPSYPAQQHPAPPQHWPALHGAGPPHAADTSGQALSAKRRAGDYSGCSIPEGAKRLRPTVKHHAGWGPFDEDGYVLAPGYC